MKATKRVKLSYFEESLLPDGMSLKRSGNNDNTGGGRKAAYVVRAATSNAECASQHIRYSAQSTASRPTHGEGNNEQRFSILAATYNGQTVEARLDSRELLMNGVRPYGIEHRKTIRLKNQEGKWEGDVLHDEPFGWGLLCDHWNNLLYEGFRIGMVNVCYGTQYYSDTHTIAYQGEWCEGRRHGKGVQYDKAGNVVYNGNWVNNQPDGGRIEFCNKNAILPTRMEVFVIGDGNCNSLEWKSLNMSHMPNLYLVQIGNNCFENVDTVNLDGLNQLEEVVIGNCCFCKERTFLGGSFALRQCEKLKVLKIGCLSFSSYTDCVIDDLPSLEMIQMGELNQNSDNFAAASLSLNGRVI